MELLYIYIDNDKHNIKQCEYNFSPNYKFSYSPENKTFDMRVLNNLPNNWFGKNITNVTAIVGKNGSGKTNLLRCLIKAIGGYKNTYIFYKYKDEIYSNIPKHLSEYTFNFNVKQTDPLEDTNDYITTYYSSSIDKDIIDTNLPINNFIDISNGHLLRIQKNYILKEPIYQHLSDVDIMQTNDIFKVLLFFIYSHNNNYKSIDTLQFPDKIEICFRSYLNKQNHPTYQALTAPLTGKFKDRLKFAILNYIFSIYQIPNHWTAKTTFSDVIQYLYHNPNQTNIFNALSNLYDKGFITYNQTGLVPLTKDYTELRFKLSINGLTQSVFDSIYSYYNPKIPYASYNSVNDQISNYALTLNYGVSSGERVFYTLIARIMGTIFRKQGEIHNSIENINAHRYDGKTAIILLDEPDIQLHPEWQQSFINLLIHFLELYFPKVNFQIIFTTHSPIMLSDIPKSNVIFLERDKTGNCIVKNKVTINETFAANIHSLYNNGFFLKGIPIGQFSKQKIAQISNRINNKDLSDSLIEDIYRIGEPIIRNALLKAFDEKRNSCNRENRINMLKKELDTLTKQQ